MRPCVGFKPKTWQKAAGTRTLPPPSLPCAIGVIPAATLAAAPALDPPGVRRGSQGLRVTPKTRFSPVVPKPNSAVLVLPTTIAPAARRRSTESASSVAITSEASDPRVKRTPAIGSRSLIETGTPKSGGRGSPASRRRSAACASARALASVTVTKAPSAALLALIAAKVAVMISTGETSRLLRRSRSSTAESEAKSVETIALGRRLALRERDPAKGLGDDAPAAVDAQQAQIIRIEARRPRRAQGCEGRALAGRSNRQNRVVAALAERLRARSRAHARQIGLEVVIVQALLGRRIEMAAGMKDLPHLLGIAFIESVEIRTQRLRDFAISFSLGHRASGSCGMRDAAMQAPVERQQQRSARRAESDDENGDGDRGADIEGGDPLDEKKAEAALRGEHLADENAEKRQGKADAQRRAKLGKDRGEKDCRRDLPGREAKDARGLDVNRRDGAHRVERNEHDRNDAMHHAEGDLGAKPEAEEGENDGVERHLGDGVERGENRLEHLAGKAPEAESETERQAQDDGERKGQGKRRTRGAEMHKEDRRAQEAQQRRGGFERRAQRARTGDPIDPLPQQHGNDEEQHDIGALLPGMRGAAVHGRSQRRRSRRSAACTPLLAATRSARTRSIRPYMVRLSNRL